MIMIVTAGCALFRNQKLQVLSGRRVVCHVPQDSHNPPVGVGNRWSFRAGDLDAPSSISKILAPDEVHITLEKTCPPNGLNEHFSGDKCFE